MLVRTSGRARRTRRLISASRIALSPAGTVRFVRTSVSLPDGFPPCFGPCAVEDASAGVHGGILPWTRMLLPVDSFAGFAALAQRRSAPIRSMASSLASTLPLLRAIVFAFRRARSAPAVRIAVSSWPNT